jgi:dipeptidyl-peptidase-4
MPFVRDSVSIKMRWGVSALLLCGSVAIAQQGRVYTDADYAKAESFMPYKTNPLVDHAVEKVAWLQDGSFWYRDTSHGAVTFMLADASRGTKAAAFDHAAMAKALGTALGTNLNADRLPIQEIESADKNSIVLKARNREFQCSLAGGISCAAAHAKINGSKGEPAVLSPDKKRAAFVRDWNLWIRDVQTGEETQLTTDGVENYGYATDNAGWEHSNKAVLLWAPDSKHIATFQQDQRKDGDMYLVSVQLGHPKLEQWKYPMPGDKDVTMIERVVIDVDSRKITRLKMQPDQHRSSLCDDIACKGGEWTDVQWSADGKSLIFLSNSRDHKVATLRVADPETGTVRDVYTETVATQFESGQGKANWYALPATNEFIWFSERSNWGQLYLYDLSTGKLKNEITHGEGPVTQVLRVDEKARVIYFLADGKEAGRDPYFTHLYRVDFDGKNQKLLTPEDADHAIVISPDGQYFFDSYSTIEKPQVAVVRDGTGKEVMPVAQADISRLVATGWKAPMPITVKGRDGKTDLYGFLFRPLQMDQSKKYPIINHVYPGPQTGSCGSRKFAAAHGDMQSLAELGFVVVCIDGMGTPLRAKSFHDFWYGKMGDNTIPDQVAGMKELAAKYPWIDIDKAGIYGHSGGGNATADAMFTYPDFFKVGIAESGNHDNRIYEDDWGERYEGLVEKSADGDSNYDNQSNITIAKNLKGKLLLAHGTSDDNVPPNETLTVVDALVKANKDFDLLLIPNAHHGYGPATNYMTRRRWDYFVENLMGATAPREYKMTSEGDVRRAMGETE